MKKVSVKFSLGYKKFAEFADFKYHEEAGLVLIFPLFFVKGDIHSEDLIFKSQIEMSLSNLHSLNILKHLNSFQVEAFFERHELIKDVLSQLKERALKWIDDSNHPLPVIFNEKEFIEITPTEENYGEFKNSEGKKGFYLTFEKNPFYQIISIRENINFESFYKDSELSEFSRKPYRIVLKGESLNIWERYFSDEDSMMKEVFKMRRCSPIDPELEIINNKFKLNE
jgi:hypothetical protein